jgi:hypothetical protein
MLVARNDGSCPPGDLEAMHLGSRKDDLAL